MNQVLADALSLNGARAIGQFWANEATPKWAGFIAVLGQQPKIDLEFFEVHHDEDTHYSGLINGWAREDWPEILAGVIEYGKLRANFMDDIRTILSPEHLEQFVNNPQGSDQQKY